MLPFFPPPYPDEILYSLCARYAKLLAYPHQRDVLRDLFGTTTVRTVVDFPTHLEHLVRATVAFIPFSCEDWIDRHTLLPAFRLGQSGEALERATAAMRSDRSEASVHALLGLLANRVRRPTSLKYCHACVIEDRQHLGEPYWHRVHQFPGVIVCPRHQVFLRSVRLDHRAAVYIFRALSDVMKLDVASIALEANTPRDQVLLSVAQSAQWLLDATMALPENLLERYTNLLFEHGLVTYRGSVRLRMLNAFLREAIGDDVFLALNGTISRRGFLEGAVDLIRPQRSAQHPLMHMLMWAALKLDPAVFLLGVTDRSRPFGVAPWPCLNAVCTHAYRKVIKHVEVRIARGNGRPLGVFACACGFRYLRFGLDRTPQDRLRFDRIEVFGAVWDGCFQRLWPDSTVSLRALRRTLGVDARTLRRQAQRLGLSLDRPGSRRSHRPHQPTEGHGQFALVDHREAYRLLWSQARAKQPEQSTTHVRKQHPEIYTWLYRHDRAWLEAANQSSQTTKRRPPGPRIDWQKRDHELAANVPEAIRTIKALPGRPVQVTRARIGTLLDAPSITDHRLKQLPWTQAVIARAVESREAFALRRVAWAKTECERLKLAPVRWRFVRMAGIRRDLEKSARTARAIQRAMVQLNQVVNHRAA